jgi:hypothetical protein
MFTQGKCRSVLPIFLHHATQLSLTRRCFPEAQYQEFHIVNSLEKLTIHYFSKDRGHDPIKYLVDPSIIDPVKSISHVHAQ